MNETTDSKKCHKIANVLTDVRLVAEPPSHLFRYRYNLTPEKKEQILKEWVSEFHDFVRDHRSCDPVILSVEREVKDLCSICGEVWEPLQDETTKEWFCGQCGAILEQQEGNL